MQQMLNHLIFLQDCLSDLWQGCPPRNVVQRARGDNLDRNPEDRSSPARVRRILSALDPRALEANEGAWLILNEVNLSLWGSMPQTRSVAVQMEHMLTTCLGRLISQFTPKEEQGAVPPVLSPLEWTQDNQPPLCRLTLQWRSECIEGWGIDAGHAIMEVGRGVLREVRLRGLRAVLDTLRVRPWDRGETYRALQAATAQHHPYDQSEIAEWMRRLLQVITVPDPGAARMIRQMAHSSGIHEDVWAEQNTYEDLALVILRALQGVDDDGADGLLDITRFLRDTWSVPTVQMPGAEMAMRTLRGMADQLVGVRWLGTLPVMAGDVKKVMERLDNARGDFVVLADGHMFLIGGWPQHRSSPELWKGVSIWPVGGCPRPGAIPHFTLRPEVAISAEEAEPLHRAAREALGHVRADLNPPQPLDARAEGVSLRLTFDDVTARQVPPGEEGAFAFTPDMKVYIAGSKLPMEPAAEDDQRIWKRLDVKPIASDQPGFDPAMTLYGNDVKSKPLNRENLDEAMRRVKEEMGPAVKIAEPINIKITDTDQHGNPQEEIASEVTAQLARALMAMHNRCDEK